MIIIRTRKEMKGVVFVVDVGKNEAILEEPAIKAKLESESKQTKEYKLEDIVEKLQHAASIREALIQMKEERLKSVSQEREEKVKRKQSSEREEKQEQKSKLNAEQELAGQRRVLRIRELVNKLQGRHERIMKTAAEVSERRTSQLQSLRNKIV